MKEFGPNKFQRLEQGRQAKDLMLDQFHAVNLQPILPEPIRIDDFRKREAAYNPIRNRRASFLQSTLASALALLGSTACGTISGSNKTPDFNANQTSKDPGAEVIRNPNNPWFLPFSPNPDMQIQQGYFYDNDSIMDQTNAHSSQDIIKKDPKTGKWLSFPVRAVADGLACKNPESRQGLTAFILHPAQKLPDNSVADLYSLSGHLNRLSVDLPECEATNAGRAPLKQVKQREELGWSGSDEVYETMKDGTKQPRPDWIHLHFQINLGRVLTGAINYARGGLTKHLDGFGIYGKSDQYPTFTNGKPCGPNALFKECPPTQALIANPKDTVTPIPTIHAITPTIQVPTLNRTETPKAVPTPKSFKPADIVQVTGTSPECLLERVSPSQSADIMKDKTGKAICKLDGEFHIIARGPVPVGGFNWWQFADNGWSADSYLNLYRSAASVGETSKSPEAGWINYLGKRYQNYYWYQVNVPNTFTIKDANSNLLYRYNGTLDAPDYFVGQRYGGYRTTISITPSSGSQVHGPGDPDTHDMRVAKVVDTERNILYKGIPLDTFSETIGGKWPATRIRVKAPNGSRYWSFTTEDQNNNKGEAEMNQFLFSTPGRTLGGDRINWEVTLYTNPAVTDQEMKTLRKMLDSFQVPLYPPEK
ncbi:MAG: hypothetical protein Q7R49_06420 [Candidatus Daviesbacteria bacterium]|nr:hypothetical protein [Candidatus Daviesbacteria bacterium]